MAQTLRVLLIQRTDRDAAVLLKELSRGGYSAQASRVDSPKGLQEALNGGPWDVIVSDSNMPQFELPSVKKILHDKGIDLPFVSVSAGKISRPVKARDGEPVCDLSRLVPAVERELRRVKADRQDAQTSAALPVSQQGIADVFQCLPEHVIFHDTNMTIQWTNKAAADSLSMRPEELIGRHCYKLWHKREEICENCPVKEALNTARSHAAEICTPDGRTWHVAGYPVFDRSNRVAGAIEITLDITERKAANKTMHDQKVRLSQATKMEAIGRLAGGVAHDFNNLLTVIQGNAELMRRKLPKASQHSETLDEILTASRRAAELVHDLLTFARKGKMETAELDVHAIISEVTGLLGHSLAPNVEIQTDLSAERFTVTGDAAQLENSLLNLGLNACDAMPKGGMLTFATRNIVVTERDARPSLEQLRPGEYLQITVSDTGEGMDAKTLSHVFEPFFTTKEAGGGTGLGLASVYGCVKHHGGRIDVHSRPGEGATFTLLLPVSQEPPAPGEDG